MTMTLFDQNRAVEMYGKEIAREATRNPENQVKSYWKGQAHTV